MPDQDLALVIVDISGYTAFMKMKAISISHAQFVITQLLEAVIDAAGSPLAINKIEGDAVLMFAPMAPPEADSARTVWERTRACFEAFNRRRRELAGLNACHCSACDQIGDLRLKAIIHRGPVVVERIKQFEELAGTAVIVVHRLVKNDLEWAEYILLTEVFCEAWSEAPWSGLPRTVQTYPDVGRVPVRVLRLDGGGAPAEHRPAPALARAGHEMVKIGWTLRTALAGWFGRGAPDYRNVPDMARRG